MKGPTNLEEKLKVLKKSSIPQGELDSSVRSDRGKLDLVATQTHGFVEGQTFNKTSVSEKLEEAANIVKTRKKAEERLRKQKEREASSKPKPTGF